MRTLFGSSVVPFYRIASVPVGQAAELSQLVRVGSFLFGVASAGLGFLALITGDGVPGLEPLPPWLGVRMVCAYATALVLIPAAVTLIVDRRQLEGALSLALLFGLWAVLLQAPILLINPHSGALWTTAFEAVALCGAAFALADRGRLARGGVPRDRHMATLGSLLFGIALPVFGALHFIYATYVATLVPAWIPWRLFWAIFTGACFAAAGVSILTGVKTRLAAELLGLMFGVWVVIVHAPRVFHSPHIGAEWSSLFIALAMCGGAWSLVPTRP